MILFICVTIFTLIGERLPYVLSYVVVLISSLNKRNKHLKNEIDRLETKLSEISTIHEFAKYARLKRKINLLKDEYKIAVTDNTKWTIIKMSFNYIGYLIVGLLKTIMVYYFWSTPMLKLDDKWLFPLDSFLSFSVQPGELGIVPWLCIVKSSAYLLKN